MLINSDDVPGSFLLFYNPFNFLNLHSFSQLLHENGRIYWHCAEVLFTCEPKTCPILKRLSD
jgi:hypothetical protein